MKRKIYIDGKHWDNILQLPCVRGLNKRDEEFVVDRVQLALLDRRIEDLQNLCSLLEKSGDKKSADKNVVPKLNEAVMLRDKLLQEADKNRRQAAKWLLMVFVSCDIAADAADAFSDVLKRISRGYETDNDFAKLVKQQAGNAREASEEWAKIVEILDDSKDYGLEMYYADMAEAIQGKVLDLVGSEVEKVMATEKGQRMF